MRSDLSLGYRPRMNPKPTWKMWPSEEGSRSSVAGVVIRTRQVTDAVAGTEADYLRGFTRFAATYTPFSASSGSSAWRLRASSSIYGSSVFSMKLIASFSSSVRWLSILLPLGTSM